MRNRRGAKPHRPRLGSSVTPVLHLQQFLMQTAAQVPEESIQFGLFFRDDDRGFFYQRFFIRFFFDQIRIEDGP